MRYARRTRINEWIKKKKQKGKERVTNKRAREFIFYIAILATCALCLYLYVCGRGRDRLDISYDTDKTSPTFFFFFFFTGKILFLRFFHLCLINRTRRIHRSTLPFAEIHVSTSIYYPWAKKFSIGRKCTKLFKISEILPNFFVYFKQRYFTREISVVFKYLFESAFVRRLFATKRMEPR